jgi:hypothetical protein
MAQRTKITKSSAKASTSKKTTATSGATTVVKPAASSAGYDLLKSVITSERDLNLLSLYEEHYSEMITALKALPFVTKEQALEWLNANYESVFPPATAIMNSDSPAPLAFMQRENVLIHGLGCDVIALRKEPCLWWQPITNPHLIELTRSIRAYHAKVTELQAPAVLGMVPESTEAPNNIFYLNQ